MRGVWSSETDSFWFQRERKGENWNHKRQKKSSFLNNTPQLLTYQTSTSWLMMKPRQASEAHRRRRERGFFIFIFIFLFLSFFFFFFRFSFSIPSIVFANASRCPLQMYRTVKTTDKPAASSGNSYCLAFSLFFSFLLSSSLIF